MKWSRTTAILGVALVAACAAPRPTPTQGLTQNSPTPNATETSEATGSPPPPPSPSPNMALGLPILTVAETTALLLQGKLNGRAVAIAGYWEETPPRSCPAFDVFIPIRNPCDLRAFADEDLPLGGSRPGGSSWRPPAPGEGIQPAVLDQMEEMPIGKDVPGNFGAVPVVVIGHGGDPRSWQCSLADRDDCAVTLVVDRLISVDGHEVGLPPGTNNLATRMTFDEVVAQVPGGRNAVLTAYPISAGRAAFLDSRLVGITGSPAWYTRAIDGPPNADGSAAIVIRLFDDASGEPLFAAPLAVDPSAEPARLTFGTRFRGTSSGPPSEVGVSQNGMPVAVMSGFSEPMMLAAGAYEISASDACSTEWDLSVGIDTHLVAVYRNRARVACDWVSELPPPM